MRHNCGYFYTEIQPKTGSIAFEPRISREQEIRGSSAV